MNSTTLMRVLVASTVVALSGGAVLSLLGFSAAPLTGSATAPEDAWVVPQRTRAESEVIRDVQTARVLWPVYASIAAPGAQAAEAAALTPPDWRIAGVIGRPGAEQLLIQRAGVPTPAALRVGDSLPGGARILTISERGVTVEIDGQRAFLSTYPR